MATEGERKRQRRRKHLRKSNIRRRVKEQLWTPLYKKYLIVCCALCGMPLTFEEATLDHIVPLSKGGTNDISNLQLAHKKCNWEKGDTI